MKYTRENLDTETLLRLRQKASSAQVAARDVVDAVDLWLRHRDEAALEKVLAVLNEAPVDHTE